ncbi:MAG TPA: hypothetical protein VLJ86_25195 [Ramlibacter sp.]|nr:hypothetical protein [Ramlibacter sp.]
MDILPVCNPSAPFAFAFAAQGIRARALAATQAGLKRTPAHS